MANRRMISKSISTSKKINRVSDKAALLFSWLIPHCDDFGHMDGTPETIKAIVVPMRKWSLSQVENAIKELNGLELIDIYKVEEETYLEIIKFNEFQTFKNDRERIALYPQKPNGFQRIPADSESIQPDSYKLSKVKLSKVKLSKVNIAEQSSAGKELNEIINLFKPLNPSYQRLFVNISQRAALSRMIRIHGREKTEWVINTLVQVNGQKYAPTITTPIQLENKLGDLIIFLKKQQLEIPTVAKIR